MVSMTVADTVDQNEWHLPTYDPRNENKYHYKLHSLDIYFWRQQDALQFVNGVRRVLPPGQVEVQDEPGPPPQPAGMSQVVQNLEQVAISDPQYGTAKQASNQTSQPRDVDNTMAAGGRASTGSSTANQPSSFVPMAYNPAAPAAPETIRHREKTPPPDEDPLNPLAVAVAYDYQKQPFTPGYPPQAQFPPGIASPGLHSSVGSPGVPPSQFGGPQHPGLQRASTMPVHGGLASPGLGSSYGSGFPGSQGVAPPPPPPPPLQQPQTQSQPTPPITSPGLPPPPAGTHQHFQYGQGGQPTADASNYSIHQQLYRPTEHEVSNPAFNPYQPKSGKLEENAGRLERGVTGMLKKFEKKFG
jgi:hypothetical protein